MKQSPVAHECRTGVAEAVALQAEHGEGRRPLAGEESLRLPPNVRLTPT